MSNYDAMIDEQIAVEPDERRQERCNAGLVGVTVVRTSDGSYCGAAREFYVTANDLDRVTDFLRHAGFHLHLAGRWEFMPPGRATLGGYETGREVEAPAEILAKRISLDMPAIR